MGEAVFTAKVINRLIGGIDMLDVQQTQETQKTHTEHKTRSFADIAVLYRTHRQAELLEKCLQREGIPYVIAGREGFLAEKTVRGCLCFFRCLTDQTDTVNRDICLKLLWDLEPSQISGSIFETMQEKYIPFLKKGKPQKILAQWIEDMNLTDDIAVNKLLGMAVFYKSMQEFMDAVSLGVESDLKRCGGRQYTADCVTLMTLHGSKGLEFPVTIIYGVRKGAIPFEREAHLKKENSSGPRETFITDIEEERRLFYVGMTRAKEELILTTSGDASVFLEDLPEESLLRESADKRKLNNGGEQLNLFDFL